MGEFDSSKTRVEPVFDALLDRDATGQSWLGALMRLGSRSGEVDIPPRLGIRSDALPRYWGKNEKRLPAPESLLKALVRCVDPARVLASGDKGETRRRRELLAEGDAATIIEALAALDAGKRGSKWFVLEGRSAPDAYIETDEIVLVVEGKRTESATTTKTKWMSHRSQLIRHMDAAMEAAPAKTIFGLLLVEGEPPDSRVVPQRWVEADRNQTDSNLFEASLPHRSDAERARIRAGVLGVATWQTVCAKFQLGWPPREKGERKR